MTMNEANIGRRLLDSETFLERFLKLKREFLYKGSGTIDTWLKELLVWTEKQRDEYKLQN